MANKKKGKKNQKKADNRKLYAIIGAVAALAVICIVACIAIFGGKKEAEPEGPVMHHAKIDIEGYGVITLELDEAAAPITVANFIELAESGFYDGLTFHRIMYNFMMQGGDPSGNGTGGSDKRITGEFQTNGWSNPISHKRGVISMARANDPNSASSQFFIVHQDSIFLDGSYAAFGYVTDGMDVVDAVCTDAQPIDNNGTILPEEQPVINSITIID